MIDFNEHAKILNGSKNYSVLSRIKHTAKFLPDDDKPKRKCLLVDVETTGLGAFFSNMGLMEQSIAFLTNTMD